MRMNNPANAPLKQGILYTLHDIMVALDNAYLRVLNSAFHELYSRQYAPNVEQAELVFNQEYSNADIHQGRQNAPVAQNEVAVIFPMNDDEGIPDFHRDFALIFKPNMTEEQRDIVKIPSLMYQVSIYLL